MSNELLYSREYSDCHVALSDFLAEVHTGTCDHDKAITNHRTNRGVLAEAKPAEGEMSRGQELDYAWWLHGRDARLFLFEEGGMVQEYLPSGSIWELTEGRTFTNWHTGRAALESFLNAAP